MRRNEARAEASHGGIELIELVERVYQAESAAQAESQRHKTDVRGNGSDAG